MKRHFCTSFDKGYLARGLALYKSLRKHGGKFHLWVLCLDGETEVVLRRLRLRHLTLVPLVTLETHDPEFLAVKGHRSKVEYYFTASPCFPKYLLGTQAQISLITYLDADLYFYRSPEPLWKEIGDADVAMIAHRFPPSKRDSERYGKYNVGWVSFRRTSNGLGCLEWWRARCLEWCYDRVEEDGRYADQKYLDHFESLPGVHIVAHPGANLAPWNLASHCLEESNGDVLIDGQELIFFHFHNLTKTGPRTFDPGLAIYEIAPCRLVEHLIYRPYLRVLTASEKVPLGTIRIPATGPGPVIGQVFVLEKRGWSLFAGRLQNLLKRTESVKPPKPPEKDTLASKPGSTGGRSQAAILEIEKVLRSKRQTGVWFLSPRAWALRIARNELKRLAESPRPEKKPAGASSETRKGGAESF